MSLMTENSKAENVNSGSLVGELEREGIVVIPDLVSSEPLRAMQFAFDSRLHNLRWNDFDGYEKTDRYRRMVQDVLTLEQGFVDAALHPVVKQTLEDYLGDHYVLAEAKGWLSLPTQKDFHGWHGDAWYDQSTVTELQREVKLAVYLTDVRSGAFAYIKGTHGQIHPRAIGAAEVAQYDQDQIVEITGNAGTGILFDTTGIHRQAYPILEPRRAVFYCYHDPSVPLQREDVEYNRYHPLVLNSAFLGGLTEQDERILGFGVKTNFVTGFRRAPRHQGFQALMEAAFGAKLRYQEFAGRVRARLNR